MILSIDFDGTIVIEDYPGIGKLRKGAKKAINQLFDNGHYIIIWTCRTGRTQLEAEMFLLDNEIKFHKINEHHPRNIYAYSNDSRKISADLYIDDKCIGGLPSWSDIVSIVNKKQAELNQINND